MLYFWIDSHIRNFQTFETNQSNDPNLGNFGKTAAYSGSFYDPNAYSAPDPIYDGSSDFDNEPPLLEGKIN